MSKLADNDFAQPFLVHVEEHRHSVDVSSYGHRTESYSPADGDEAVAHFVGDWRRGDATRFCDTDQLGVALLARCVIEMEKELGAEARRLEQMKETLAEARRELDRRRGAV